MGFDIDYGSPGIIGIAAAVLLVFAGVIILAFVLGFAKTAHDDIVQEIEDEGGDLKG